ncbi:MAG: hypothetical protein LBE74_02850 [Treponema sp.]|jgi:hypothetical protein|nr:hypothetical protein [Treponema sp.]
MRSNFFRAATVGIAILIFSLLTCENAGLGNVGLGKVVDTKAPTASIIDPLPSSFIKGEQQLFKISAEDDVGLAKDNPVSIAFVNDDFNAYKNGDRTVDDPWIPAFYNAADKLYYVYIDTQTLTNSIDGQYSFRIRARDESGRPPFESDDLVYTVKNGLPTIELLIPKVDWNNLETDPEKAPEVLNSGFLSGVASDLQGVEAGYPWIQLWKDGEAEPAVDDWTILPNPGEGGKSFAFRYYTTGDGEETLDAKEYLESGVYHVKFKVKDINGLEAVYPETGFALINVTGAAEAPKITIEKLSNQQQKEAFVIRAEATHSVGIESGSVNVFNEYSTNLTFTKDGVKYGIPWASIVLDAEEDDRKVVFESPPIRPGQALDNLVVIGGGGGNFIFPDDTYDFDVEAISIRADRAAASYANITIDTIAPSVEITNVAPTSTRDDEPNGEYVNGKITVDFAATDDNGLGLETDGKRRLKYYVSQTRQTSSPEELYEKGEWFDSYPSNGPVTIGSAKRMTVNTAYIRPDNEQALYEDNNPLYIYLAAKDKAGNTAFVERVVNIDQSTDYPVFRFTNEQVSSFAELGETPYQTPSVLGSANARLGGTVEDDDALHVDVDTGGGLRFSIWKEEKGKNPASTNKYTYTIGLTGNKSAKFDISLEQMGAAKNAAAAEIGGGTVDERLPLPEGGYYYTMEIGDLASAKNGLGAAVKKTDVYYIAVDLKDPEINITSPQDNAFVDPNLPLLIEGNFVETNLAANVGANDFILRISNPHRVGAAPGNEDYTKVTPGENGGWSFTFGEGVVIDETNRQITLEGKDRFGRTTEKVLTVRIDREAPVVNLIKFPVENTNSAVSSVMTADMSINGTAVDGPTGSASGVEQVFYQITNSADSPSLPTDYNEPGGWKLANGGAQWSAVETLSSTQQGSQYLHVFVRDAVHNVGAVKSTRFEVDTENPEIGDVYRQGTVPVGTTYYAKGDFSLKFTAFDSNALGSVLITRKKSGATGEDVTPTIEKDGVYKGDFADARYGGYTEYNEKNLWGVTLAQEVGEGKLDSGGYEYTLLTRDAANKTVTQTYTVVVDITPPEIEVTGVSPTVAEAGGVYTVNGIARATFNASDNEGIGEYGANRQIKYLVSYTEIDAGDAVYEDMMFVDALANDPGLNYNDGKTGSVMVKFSESKALYIDTRKLTDKTTAYLYIAAQDRAGNTSFSKTAFYVDQDVDTPTIAFTDIDTTIATVSDLLTKTPTNLFGTDVKIRGTFADDDAIDPNSAKLTIWKEADDNKGAPSAANKKIVQLSGLSVSGTAAFNANSQTLGGAFNETALPEGVYFFTLEVSDFTSGDFMVTPAKKTTVGPFCFAVDTDDPKITVSSPASGSYQSNTFTLTGIVSDHSNKDASLPPRLLIKDPAHTAAEEITLTAYDAIEGEWAWTYTVTGIDANNTTVNIVAYDRFGKERTSDFKVAFDDAAPVVTINQPVINRWFEGVTTSFSGSLSDNSQKDLQKVYYYIMKPGVAAVPTVPTSPLDATKDAAAHADGWREAVISGGAWSVTVDLNDDATVEEGTSVLYVIGYDAAGNGPDRDEPNWSNGAPVWSGSWAGGTPLYNTAASTLVFGVDRSAPDASLLKFYKTSNTSRDEALADKAFVKETFALYGVATDSNELASLVVKQNGVVITPIDGELVKTNGKSWTVDLKNLPRDPTSEGLTLANPEGVYVYTVEVADRSVGLNHTVTLTQTITVDKSGPVVTVTSPGEGEPFNSASITVTGTADDGTNGAGVSKVYFRTGAIGYDVPVGEISGADWMQANGTSQWSRTGVQIGSIEGELKFSAFAEDVLGNRGAAVVHDFYVDASNPEILDESYTDITMEKYTNGAFTLKFSAFDSNILNAADTEVKGKLAGVVVTRTSGGVATEIFNSYTAHGGFAVDPVDNIYTDASGNTLRVAGEYKGVLNSRNPSINDYSKEKLWGVTLSQNDSKKNGDTIGGTLADGIYDYAITVTDAGGRSASKTVTITVDALAPSIDVTKFTALVSRDLGAGALDYVNGVIQFAISASDENGLAATNPLQYWVLPKGAAPTVTAWSAAGGTFFNRSEQPLIDTAEGLDNQSSPQAFDQAGTEAASAYTLYIGAMDKAGNIGVTAYNTEAHSDYSFIVNQDTDKPIIAITSPDNNAYVGKSHLVQGVLTDDDGFKTDANNSERIEIEYSFNGEEGDWTPVTGAITTKKVSDYEYNFTYSVADVGDEHVWIRITAKDDETKKLAIEGSSAASASAVGTINFTIDSILPVITVTTTEDTFNKNFTLAGSFVEKNYKAGSLMVGINGGTKTPVTPSQDDGFDTNNKWNWTYAVDLASLQDGMNTIELEVYDQRDQVHRTSVVATKDVTYPTVAISEFKNFVTVTTNGESVHYVNGVVKWTVVASDDIGVKETRYWLLPSTVAAPTADAMSVAVDSAGAGTAFTNREVLIDTAADSDNQATPAVIADETEYTLYVGVSDKAGNAVIYTYLPNEDADYSFKVDQSTDEPTWTFDNLSVTDLSENFIAGGILNGTVVDDDGFADVNSLVIQFAGDDNGAPGAWNELTGFNLERTRIGAREIKWSTSLPSGISDGVYYLRLTATDHGEKKVGTEGDKNFYSLPVQFTLDKTPPVPAITTVGSADGALAATVSTAPSIKGTLTETNPLSLTLTVKNGAGVTVASGTFDEEALKAAFNSWEWTWTGDAFSDLPDGPYTAVVETLDKVGTQEHSGTVQTVFNKDVEGPAVTFSNLSKEMVLTRELMLEVADASTGSSDYTGWTAHGLADNATLEEIHTKALEVYNGIKADITDIIRNTDANLRGTFTDEYSSVARFEYRFDTDPYDETAVDDSTKTLWRSGNGKLGNPNAKNTSWVIPIPAKNETDSGAPYNANSTYPTLDGVRRVTIRVYDALGNASEKMDVAFYLDREAPVFNLNSFNGEAIGNDAAGTVYSLVDIAEDTATVFTLKGNVTDANISTLTLAGGAGIILAPSNETEGGKDFTVTVTKAQFAALADGVHTLTFTATDVALNNAQTAWNFVKDTTPPENTFLNMGDQLGDNMADAPFIFGDASARIMGSTTDVTSGLASLTYTLQAKNGNDWNSPEVKADEQALTATPTWNIVLGSGTGGLNLSDGNYRIHVVAKDKAKKTAAELGDAPNVTVNGAGLSEWIYFVLDTVNPDLTVEPIKPYYNGDVPLKGTATDTNGVDKIEVWFSATPTNRTTLSPDVDDAWSTTMLVTGLAQGQQVVNVMAYDKAGHTTTQQFNFVLDTTPPTDVVVIQPNKSGERVIGPLSVRGTTSDENAVAKIFYQIGKPDVTPTETITAGQAYTISTLGDYTWTDVGAPPNAAIGTSFIATADGTATGTSRATAWKDTNLDSGTATGETEPTTITWSGGVWAWNVAFGELKYFVSRSGAAAYDGIDGNGEKYGAKRYRYTSSDDDTLVEYVGGNANDTGLTTAAPENNVWDVPVNVLVFDMAGNAKALDFYITVDPHMDKATTTILTPDGSQTVGGTVRLTGISSDNNAVNSVWVRVSGAHTAAEVWVDGDKNKGYQDWNFYEWTETGADSVTDKWYDWTDGTGSPAANTTYSRESSPENVTSSDSLYYNMGVGWHKANIQSGNGSGLVNWFINLNANGKLNPPDEVAERIVCIEVFARDTKADSNYQTELNSVNGYIARHVLSFSSNVPIIENVKVKPQGGGVGEDYTYQMQISKTITIEADVKDSDGLSALTVQRTGGTWSAISVMNETDKLIDNVATATARISDGKIKQNGDNLVQGMKYYVVNAEGQDKTFTAGENATASGTLYEADDEGYFTYRVTITIPSDSLFADSTGTYGLTLAAMDDSMQGLSTSFAMSFQIDNYFPRVAYTAALTAVGDYTLRGTTNDAPPSGSIQGLKSVVVYFSRTVSGTTTYYMPKATTSAGVITHEVSSDAASWTTVSARKWDGTTLAAPGNVLYPVYSLYSGYGIVIDNDETATGEKDGDNFVEYWYDNAGSEKVWGATFDSTKIGDGRITIHYIAEDQAGNRTYAEQEVYFQNHAPSITSLTLGTPLIGSTIVTEGKKTVSDRYLDAQFTVRNKVFQIGLAVSGGNGAKYYRVGYITRSDNAAASITKGGIYTVAKTNAGFDFKTVGAQDNAVGAAFVATRDENSLNGALVFEYTSTTIIKNGEDSGNAEVVFSDTDFDVITDSDEYAVVRNGGSLIKGRKYRIEELGNTNWANLVGLANAEKGSTFIPLDNDVTMSGTGVAVTSNDRYFSVKVWDTTLADPSATEADQLSDFEILAVRVGNKDSRPPITQLYDLNPKAENTLAASVNPVVIAGTTTSVQNNTKGSLYIRDKKISGHIEPRDGVGNGTNIDATKASVWLEHVLDVDGNDTGDIKPTGFMADTVSGVVTLRGSAEDDQRVAAIYLDFGGTNRLKILEADTNTGQLQRPTGLTADDVGLYQELSVDGHVVEWTYRWDTGTLIDNVTTATLGDITVTVRAEDASAPQGNAGAAGATGISEAKLNAADNADYNSIGLTLAPYVTTLTRFKNSAGTTTADEAPVLRSKNGWFSFRRSVGDAERLQIEGFNLGDANQSVSIDGAAAVTTVTQNGTSYYIDVPATATSGFVTYTAGGVAAVNNRNNNANSWNTSQEALAGNDSSTLWNDDRAAHLFDSHNIETGANQGHFRNPTVVGSIVKPAMTIDPGTGRLWASWSSYMINANTISNNSGGGTGGTFMPMYYSHNSDGAGTTALPNNARPVSWAMDPSEDTDIAWNDTNSKRSIVYLANYMTSGYDDGALSFWDEETAPSDTASLRDLQGKPVERFNSIGNFQLLQFINPRIAYGGNVAHIAYYDAKYRLLRYWNSNKSMAIGRQDAPGVVVEGDRPSATILTFVPNAIWDVSQAGYLARQGREGEVKAGTLIGRLRANSDLTGTVNARLYAPSDGTVTFLLASAALVQTGSTEPAFAMTPSPVGTPDVGNYNAIDVNSAGIPVVVYLQQDETSGAESLKYAYGNAADATAFSAADVATAGISTAGRYVSMRIDKDTATDRLNVMHIVFMDSDNGDLVYVKGTPQGATGAYTFAAPVVIDSVGNVGKWADIAIDADGNPIVSYLDQGGIDSRTGLKTAFYDPALGGWEYVTLPGRYAVNDVRTQVECDSRAAGVRNWDAAFAYVSGDYYRISYYVK